MAAIAIAIREGLWVGTWYLLLDTLVPEPKGCMLPETDHCLCKPVDQLILGTVCDTDVDQQE